MRRVTFGLWTAVLVLSSVVARAGVTEVKPPAPGEASHEQLLEGIYGGDFVGLGDDLGNGLWSVYSNGVVTATRIDDFGLPEHLNLLTGQPGEADDDTWTDGTTIATVIARFASFPQTFGYDAGDGFRPLFDIAGHGFSVSGSATTTFATGSVWRWARANEWLKGMLNAHYSDPAWNSDGLDHMVTYRVARIGHENDVPPVWLLFWEDLNGPFGSADDPFNNGIPADREFNDLVVELAVTRRAGHTEEPGWDKYDWTATWTGNESNYFSLYTGQPKGAPPYLGLDNGIDGPGRPDPEDVDYRVLRGFVLAWAVDNAGYQVSWNHLSGIATIVRYDDQEAWEYGAYAFQTPQVSTPGVRVGGVPGRLELNGADYDAAFDRLLLDFYASGSAPFSNSAQQLWAMVDTDITLLPLVQDLRQNGIGPVHTAATFDVWNSNEDFLSHTSHCLWCWDQVLLSDLAQPNNFLLDQLQTDKGKARIDGLAGPSVCDDPNCCPRGDEDCKRLFAFHNNGQRAPMCSEDTPLVGVANKIIAFSGRSAARAYTGVTLSGQGLEAGQIDSDLPSQPEQAAEPPLGASTGRIAPVQLVSVPRDRGSREAAADNKSNTIAGEAQLDCGDGACHRVSASNKGSLLVFPSVELRFEGVTGTDGTTEWRLAQDTFLSITNDFSSDVLVHFVFVNGDDPRVASIPGN